MAHIKFNFLELRHAANEIDSYISQIQSYMLLSNAQTHFFLHSYWSGPDYDAFIAQWDKSKDQETSTTQQMINALNNYANYLRLCATLYENAFISVLEKADNLP